jgi:type IV secretion system protein VirB10
VNRSASLQQRVSRAMAITLIGVIGVGILGWYYSHAFSQAPAATARSATRGADADMALPALGRVTAPNRPLAESAAATAEGASPENHYVIGNIAGSPPPLGSLAMGHAPASATPYGAASSPALVAEPPDRRLSGAVFVGPNVATPTAISASSDAVLAAAGADIGASGAESAPLVSSASAPSLSHQLKTPVTLAVLARRLPTQRLLLPRGASIDCTLVTAVDSSLPGLVTCLTATDTFSADGHVVLLERGTTLVGETRGVVRAGAARVFIVWTEARTPTGVVAELDSPATDALGRAGVDGHVERHFWERFGAAMLLSVIDGAVQAQMSQSSGGTTIVTGSSGSSQVVDEVLKSTVSIQPTVRIAQGTRVQALVARDIDFRSVYELHTVAAQP